MRWPMLTAAVLAVSLVGMPAKLDMPSADGAAVVVSASQGRAWSPWADAPLTLMGVVIPARGQSCGGQGWECGRHVADIVDRHMRAWRKRCGPLSLEGYRDTATDCGAYLRNLAEWLVAEGWAVPRPEAMGDYGVALIAARKARRGMWGGGSMLELALHTVPLGEPAMPEVLPVSDRR